MFMELGELASILKPLTEVYKYVPHSITDRRRGQSRCWSEFGSIHHTAVWALLALKMKIILLSGLLYICLLLFGFFVVK